MTGTSARATSRARTAAPALASALVSALLLGGCAYTSPSTTQLPYEPADGTSASVGELAVRNLLVVSEGDGEPGQLVGTLANRGLEDLQVEMTLTAEGASFSETVEVPANTTVVLGPDGEDVEVDSVPAPAGALVPMELRTAAGGEQVRLQVFLPEGYYEGYGPSGSGADEDEG